MFDFSLGEILLVLVVAVVFIGPKELPVVVRACVKAWRSVRALSHEVRKAFDDLVNETGLKDATDDINQSVQMIKGDDGKWYESYGLQNPKLKSDEPKP